MEPTFESLPDEIIVKIGISAAKLCGIRDFLSLSRASKRLQGILADSQETVDEIVKVRISDTIRRHPIGSRVWCALAACKIKNLKQLDVCERLTHHNLMGENRIPNRVHWNTLSRPSGNQMFTFTRAVDALMEVLPHHPSLRVALHVHDGLYTLSPGMMRDSKRHVDFVVNQIGVRVGRRHNLQNFKRNLDLCFVIYRWGTRFTEKSIVGGGHWGWIEVKFEMDEEDGGGSGTTTIASINMPGQRRTFELPPRPDIYEGLVPSDTCRYHKVFMCWKAGF